MYIKHDYTYIAASSERLAKNGFGKQTVFSLTLGRYFTEAERQENSRIANSCTREEWSERCDAFSKSLDKPLSEIMKILCEKYDIHQTTQEKSSIQHYKSDWDLFFWSNRGWNGQDHMDTIQLTFNSERPIEYREKILEELLPMLEKMEYKNIGCRVQYCIILDDKKIFETAESVYNEALAGKFLRYDGFEGKIKIVGKDRVSGENCYGFFRKGAKKKYYPISSAEIVLMGLKE